VSGVLLLTTVHEAHARRSGYQALADYLPDAECLRAQRADPASSLGLLLAKLGRQLAFSRWYLGGSAVLEARAFRRIRRGFRGVVHCMWADHDLGYLDLLLSPRRHRLCGTFHNCADTLAETIRFPDRLRRFAAIVAVSKRQLEYFVDHRVDPAKLHVVLHGVDTSFYRPPSVARSHQEFVVLAVGGYRRNFSLLRAVCTQLRHEPGVRFHIVAPPEKGAGFTGLPNVTVVSKVSDEELVDAYWRASCFLLLVENATANNALLEAMACGLPVVAEDIGGLREYVTPECGALIPPRDSEAVASAILSLRDSREQYARQSAASRTRAEQLDWGNIAREMASIYGGLLRDDRE
jgi:glycosyltransferase involved in cell wall biosynthesis